MRLKAADVLTLANNVIDKLTGNANFPALPVTVADLTTRTAAFSNAIDEAAGKDRQKLAALREAKKTLVGLLRSDAEYVNIVAAGDEAMLLTSGFELTKRPERHHLPEEIREIEAEYTDIPQTILLRWSRSRFAKSYQVFMSQNNGQTWTLFDTVFGRKLMCEALTSGTRYMFKVVPVNNAGEGVESDSASQIAA